MSRGQLEKLIDGLNELFYTIEQEYKEQGLGGQK
jgi:hypothetical protein